MTLLLKQTGAGIIYMLVMSLTIYSLYARRLSSVTYLPRTSMSNAGASLEVPSAANASGQASVLTSSQIHQRRYNVGRGPGGGLIYFSTYRIDTNAFMAVGLYNVQLHDLESHDSCRWLMPDGTSILGRIFRIFPRSARNFTYQTVLLKCVLSNHTLDLIGGSLTMTVYEEEVVVYEEETGSELSVLLYGDFLTRKHLTYCSSPLFGSLNAQAMKEWLEYHVVTHAIDHFHIYDAGGVDDDMMKIMQPYIDARKMDITDVRNVANYDVLSHGQEVAINDCVLRTKATSRWSLLTDIDEYLEVTAAPYSIGSFLQSLPEAPWVSFGCLPFAINLCSAGPKDSPGAWAIEKLVFRQLEAYCRNPKPYASRDVCVSADGHRKILVNPQKVDVVRVHQILHLAEKAHPVGDGLDAPATAVRLNHFRRIGLFNETLCKHYLQDSDPVPINYVRDLSLAKLAAAARQHIHRRNL